MNWSSVDISPYPVSVYSSSESAPLSSATPPRMLPMSASKSRLRSRKDVVVGEGSPSLMAPDLS